MWWVALSGLRFKSSEIKEVSILKWVITSAPHGCQNFQFLNEIKKLVTGVINERLSPSGKQKCATRI